MIDIVERLRDHDRHIRGRLIEGLTDPVIDDMVEAADEIERLREALRLADAALRGSNMNMKVVEKKVLAALRGEE